MASMAAGTSAPPIKPPDPLIKPSSSAKTYASVVHGTAYGFDNSQVARSFPRVSIPRRKCSWINGVPSVTFSQEEIMKSAETLKFALVAKFFGPRPSVDEIRAVIHSSWGLEGEPFVGVINSNHLLLRFQSESDCIKAWAKDVHVIKGISFKVFPWSTDFHPGIESSLSAIWVRLPLLPCHMFEEGYLASIVSAAGKFLCMDQATLWKTRPSLARVCIEVNLCNPLPPFVEVIEGNKKRIQRLEYERVPLFCSHCWIRGHSLHSCSRKRSQVMNPNPKVIFTAIPKKPNNSTEHDIANRIHLDNIIEHGNSPLDSSSRVENIDNITKKIDNIDIKLVNLVDVKDNMGFEKNYNVVDNESDIRKDEEKKSDGLQEIHGMDILENIDRGDVFLENNMVRSNESNNPTNESNIPGKFWADISKEEDIGKEREEKWENEKDNEDTEEYNDESDSDEEFSIMSKGNESLFTINTHSTYPEIVAKLKKFMFDNKDHSTPSKTIKYLKNQANLDWRSSPNFHDLWMALEAIELSECSPSSSLNSTNSKSGWHTVNSRKARNR